MSTIDDLLKLPGILLLTYLKNSFNTHPRLYLLILEREDGEGGREREREKHQCERQTLIGCLSIHPHQGPNPQASYVPWLGIKPATFWCTG